MPIVKSVQKYLAPARNSPAPVSILPPAAQFRVASINEAKCILTSFNRRDFFKIPLIREGNSQLLYASRGYKIQGPARLEHCRDRIQPGIRISLLLQPFL